MPFDSAPDAEVTARDRMIRLRDFLAALPPVNFNMDDWGIGPGGEEFDEGIKGGPECGTVCCIGGWADFLRNGKVKYDMVGTREWLGLSVDQASELFFPGDYESKPLPLAIAVLDHYLATGEIDWGIAF